MNTTEGSTVKIDDREYVVTSFTPFDGPLSTEYMLDRGIAAMAVVRMVRTGRVEKMIYITTEGTFGGWV